MIAPVTDGEVLTNYQVLPLSRCPWWFLCITVLDGCQKELQHFSDSQNPVQTEYWKCWNSVDVIACEKAPGPHKCSKKWLQWYWKGLDKNRRCSLPLTMWGRLMSSRFDYVWQPLPLVITSRANIYGILANSFTGSLLISLITHSFFSHFKWVWKTTDGYLVHFKPFLNSNSCIWWNPELHINVEACFCLIHVTGQCEGVIAWKALQ